MLTHEDTYIGPGGSTQQVHRESRVRGRGSLPMETIS